MLEILPQSRGVNIACKATGIVCESDYDAVLPEFERRIKEGLQFRLLLDWEHLDGWETEAKEARFGVRFMHRWRCERLAIVTEDPEKVDEIKDLQQLFPKTTVLKVFPPAEFNNAWTWLIND